MIKNRVLEYFYNRLVARRYAAQSGLFDKKFYNENYPDVAELGADPILHYLNHGWKEGRDPSKKFSTMAYIERYEDVRICGVNPLIHYLKYGKKEGRLLRAADGIVSSTDLIEMKEKFFYQHLRIVPYYPNPYFTLAPDARISTKIAVHLHLFNVDVAQEIFTLLGNIPEIFDLYLSVSEGAEISEVESRFRAGLSNVGKVIVAAVPNRGGDIAPLIIEFGRMLQEYEVIAHLHTKRTQQRHGGDRFEGMMSGMLGSSGKIVQILRLFESDAKVVYAGLAKLPSSDSGWSNDFDLASKIAKEYFGIELGAFRFIDSPQGSVFWANPAKLANFLNLPLRYEDFSGNSVKTDGALARALERLILVLDADKPGRNYKIRSQHDAAGDPRWYESQLDFSALTRNDVKVLAYYLPQFHPTPENDEWHGAGFTEWHKAATANPLFAGHYQQHVPHPDIDYYSLEDPWHLYTQADMMRKSGVHGMVFYHYWFDGRMILERPAKMLLDRPDIDMPFCFCWANENWTRRWDGNEQEILLGQKYSVEDARKFIEYLIPFFRDPRYLRVGDRPVFFVYRPASMELPQDYVRVWREVCVEAGLAEPYVVATLTRGASSPVAYGMDAGAERVLHDWTDGAVQDVKAELTAYGPINGGVLNYSDVADHYMAQPPAADFEYFRSLVPVWDNTPRYGAEAFVLHRFTTKKFQDWLDFLVRDARERLPEDRRFVLVNAWNEWAEGAHLEPDTTFGYAYLNCVGRSLAGKNFENVEAGAVARLAPSRIRLEIKEEVAKYFKKYSTAARKFSVSLAEALKFANAEIIEGHADALACDFVLEFAHPCLFRADTLATLIKAADRYAEYGICANPINDVDLSCRVQDDALTIPYDARSGMCLLPVGALRKLRGYKLCPQAPCFTFARPAMPYEDLGRADAVSTVVRYHKSGESNLLLNALYSLIVQFSCKVKCWIGMQDLSAEEFSRLSDEIRSLPWEADCQPIIRDYRSEGGVGDLRSVMLNEGIRAVPAGYAAFVDYDDVLYPDAYLYFIRRLAKSDKAVVFGRVYSADISPTGRVLARRFVYNYGASCEDFRQHNHAPLHSFMLDTRKIDFLSIEYFPDMRYMEDYYMTLQIFSPDNADWSSLKLPRFVGDYSHRIGAEGHTLAVDDAQRSALLKSESYMVCERRIAAMREKLKLADDNAAPMQGA